MPAIQSAVGSTQLANDGFRLRPWGWSLNILIISTCEYGLALIDLYRRHVN